MGLPIRSSVEIAAILNKSQHGIADLGLQIINEKKRGLTITNRDHRDKVYRLILLRIYLQNILTPEGALLNYYTAAVNEKKLNKILDGLVHLSKSFDGPSIPLLGTKNLPLVFYPGGSANSGSAGGGPATPGGTVFQGIANTGSTLIDTFNASISRFAFYIVSVSGANGGEGTRTSIMSATWRDSNDPVFTETKTEDVGGITTPLTLSVNLAAGMIQLNATASTDGWTITGLRILFQNISFVNPLGPLPAGGTLGQFLRKSSNLDYQADWETFTCNMITDLLASATELNKLQGVITTQAQFNFLNTLSSNVQTQLNSLNTALANYLLLSGGTMTGNIAMGTHKITGLGAASGNGDALRYEQLIGQYLLLSGGTMSGGLNMNGQLLTNLPTAVNPSDAVRLDQVPIPVSFTTSGLIMGSGWTNTSFRFKLLGTGEVKLDGWVTKSSATNGDIAFTLPVGYIPSTTKVFPISDFGFLSGPGFFASISSSGVCTIYQNNWSSGGMVGSNYSFDSIIFSL